MKSDFNESPNMQILCKFHANSTMGSLEFFNPCHCSANVA